MLALGKQSKTLACVLYASSAQLNAEKHFLNSIWLTDLSRKLPPTTQLDGFDISLDQAEPLAWLPGNVNLRKWDIMTDVPSDLIGKYDVVHIRLFIFVVPVEGGPKPLLEKLVKLLSMLPFPQTFLLKIFGKKQER